MLNRKKILTNLTTSIFGRNLFYFPEIDSTNKMALQLAREGAPEGSVVCTDFQTRGNGRLEREWHSAKGENMIISIILRPEMEIQQIQKITLAMAVIVKSFIHLFLKKSGVAPMDIALKWPNDLLINGKKIAGILAQSILKDKYVQALVVGIGLNINEKQESFPDHLHTSATSLMMETGKHIKLNRFTALFLSYFEEAYVKMERQNYQNVIEEWKQNCEQLGQAIDVITIGKKQRALFHNVDEDGYLIYKLADDTFHTLTSGEINFITE